MQVQMSCRKNLPGSPSMSSSRIKLAGGGEPPDAEVCTPPLVKRAEKPFQDHWGYFWWPWQGCFWGRGSFRAWWRPVWIPNKHQSDTLKEKLTHFTEITAGDRFHPWVQGPRAALLPSPEVKLDCVPTFPIWTRNFLQVCPALCKGGGGESSSWHVYWNDAANQSGQSLHGGEEQTKFISTEKRI